MVVLYVLLWLNAINAAVLVEHYTGWDPPGWGIALVVYAVFGACVVGRARQRA